MRCEDTCGYGLCVAIHRYHRPHSPGHASLFFVINLRQYRQMPPFSTLFQIVCLPGGLCPFLTYTALTYVTEFSLIIEYLLTTKLPTQDLILNRSTLRH